jgi:hypothetical protein
MRKYVIEREIPGAGTLSDRDLQALSRKSVRVLQQMGPDIQWVHSYVTGDRIYCVYLAASEDLLREHARQGEFPVTRIAEVANVIDPTTAG